jgi:hypothetical protein
MILTAIAIKKGLKKFQQSQNKNKPVEQVKEKKPENKNLIYIVIAVVVILAFFIIKKK